MSTIREVAALAGVSIATVSRVINNDTTYKMTDETRDRVWRAIIDLNYKAPASRRKPAPSETPSAVKKIGCVIKLRGAKYSDPYYLSLLSGIKKCRRYAVLSYETKTAQGSILYTLPCARCTYYI